MKDENKDPMIFRTVDLVLGEEKISAGARITHTQYPGEFFVYIDGPGFSGKVIYDPIAWRSTITSIGNEEPAPNISQQQINRDVVPQIMRHILGHPPFVDSLEAFRQESIVKLDELIKSKEEELGTSKKRLEAFQLRGPYEPGVGAEGQIFDYLVANGLADKIEGRHKIFREDILERKD